MKRKRTLLLLLTLMLTSISPSYALSPLIGIHSEIGWPLVAPRVLSNPFWPDLAGVSSNEGLLWAIGAEGGISFNRYLALTAMLTALAANSQRSDWMYGWQALLLSLGPTVSLPWRRIGFLRATPAMALAVTYDGIKPAQLGWGILAQLGGLYMPYPQQGLGLGLDVALTAFFKPYRIVLALKPSFVYHF